MSEGGQERREVRGLMAAARIRWQSEIMAPYYLLLVPLTLGLSVLVAIVDCVVVTPMNPVRARPDV